LENVVTHIKPDGQSWVVDMTPEMARAAGVAEGSLVVLYFKDGAVTAELLPPPSEELKEEVQQVIEEFGEAFAEMKRRGD
jgi:hypothetical protein